MEKQTIFSIDLYDKNTHKYKSLSNMRNKHLTTSILLFLSLVSAWGQGVIDIDLSTNNEGGITITEDNSVYRIHGTYDVQKQKLPSQETGYGTTDQNKSKAVIVVASGIQVKITLENVNIENLPEDKYYCALYADEAKKVELTLTGDNSLVGGHDLPAICAPTGKDSELIIKGDGKLTAKGGEQAAGIGSRYSKDAKGTITIEDGTIIAYGNGYGAGIGTSANSNGGTIRIKGGNITATGGDSGPGIGVSGTAAPANPPITSGTIEISGGIVNATGYNGMGAGEGKVGETVTISGGIISAITNKDGGKAINASSYVLPSGQNSAIIFLKEYNYSSIEGSIKGSMIDGNNVDITHYTIDRNYEIPSGYTLHIRRKQTLTIADGVTLTNEGTISNEDSGTIDGNGTIENNKDLKSDNTNIKVKLNGHKIKYKVNFQTNYPIDDGTNSTEYLSETDTLRPGELTYTYYTLVEGWYDDREGGNQITKITGPMTLYAHWTENLIKTTASPATLEGTYATPLKPNELYELSGLLAPDTYSDKSGYKFEIDGKAYGLTVNNDNKLCGSPNKVTTTSGTTIRIAISHVNCEKPESVDIPVIIHPRTLTVTPRADQILYKGETPKYDTSGEATGETAAFSGQLAVDSPANLIIPGDLKLIDNGKFLASNYKLELKPDILCTYIDMLPEEAHVQLDGDKKGEWYTETVTFSAPPGFTIKQKEVKETDIQTKAISGLIASDEVFVGSFTFSQEGTFDVTYLLKRDDPYTREYEHKATDIRLDLNAPTVTVSTNNLGYTLTATDGKGSGIASVLIDGTSVQLTSDRYDGSGSKGLHTYKVTDHAGHESAGTFNLATPPPVYTVVIPKTGHATLTPSPGTHYYEEGDRFLLYLKLDSAYSQSTPVVKANGQTITPNRDGSYTIAVYSDIQITIEGIVPDSPVSTTQITDNKSRIYSSGGILYINTTTPLNVSITALTGKLIRHSSLPAGSNSMYGLPVGFYIVKLSDGTTAKVAIAWR